MVKKGSVYVFKGKYWKADSNQYLKDKTFKDMMLSELKNHTGDYKDILGRW